MKTILAFLFVFLLVAVCRAESSESHESEDKHGFKVCVNKAVPLGQAKYSYDPSTGMGPEDWGKLKGYWKCGVGKEQSPINMDLNVKYRPFRYAPKTHMTLAPMTFHASNSNWAMLCAKKKSCGYTIYNNVKYWVINSHLHSPSEHTYLGRRYLMESHIVHQSDKGKLLVIGTFFDTASNDSLTVGIHEGKNKFYGANAFISKMMKGSSKDSEEIVSPINLGGIMNPGAGSCAYKGSLTTPPCSEGVQWIMQLGIQTVTKAQVHHYQLSAGTGYFGNYRPEQKRNGRTVACYV